MLLTILFSLFAYLCDAKSTKPKESLKLMHWNIHGKTFKGASVKRADLLTSMIQEHQPDVLFVNEPQQKNIQNYLGEIENGKRQGLKYNDKTYEYMGIVKECGFLYRPGLLKQIEWDEWYPIVKNKLHEQNEKKNLSMLQDYKNARIRSRTMFAETSDFVLISFHGRHKRGKDLKTNEKRMHTIKAKGISCLFRIAELIGRQRDKTVIIGGDFNFNVFDHLTDIQWPIGMKIAQRPKRLKKATIDYFMYIGDVSIQSTKIIESPDVELFDHEILQLEIDPSW